MTPLCRDLSQRQIGTTQLGSERVQADENLRHFVVILRALQHINAASITPNLPQFCEPLRTFLVTGIVKTTDTFLRADELMPKAVVISVVRREGIEPPTNSV